MTRVFAALMATMLLGFVLACGSADNQGASAPPAADVSSFPTPTRSQAASAQPTAEAAPSQQDQRQPEASEDGEESGEAAPMTQEELRQLRQRMQSGQLSEQEMQLAVARMRAQFGGEQGGRGGGFGGVPPTQVVGEIEGIEGNALTVTTELASVTANLSENANVQITDLLEASELTDGANVLVVSERVDGATLARMVTILPAEAGGFGRGLAGRRGQGGQDGAGRPLIGPIASVSETGFTLETQQGPLPIAIDAETLITRTRQGTLADLAVGMRVRVFGVEREDGQIEARNVSVTPEGLDGIPGFGGGFGGR